MAEPPRTVEMIAGEDQGDSATEEGEAQPESLPNGNEAAEELEWHPPANFEKRTTDITPRVIQKGGFSFLNLVL